MHFQKPSRRAAIQAAQEALLEKVRANPERVMESVLNAPHLLAGIQDIDTVFDILLEKGFHAKLVQLAGASALPKYLRGSLVSKLL